MRVVLLNSSNFTVMKVPSRGVGGSDFCSELVAAALFSNSGIGRIKFVRKCLEFTVLVHEVKTLDEFLP